MPDFRRQEIRSRKYLDASRGQPCTLQITGTCTGNTETTVAAHVRDETFGMAQKADDISVVDACQACHDVFDGRTHRPLTEAEWNFYARRGLQRTLRNRVLRGIVIIPLDAERLSSERPVKPRKPPEQRTPIPQPAKPRWPQGRKINSANNLRRKETSNA